MWFKSQRDLPQVITPEQALEGRRTSIPSSSIHPIFGLCISSFDSQEHRPEHLKRILFGMGCFWGAERLFWRQPGVCMTNVGYAGGYTPNPTYEEVCSGLTGHVEVVQVYFDSKLTSLHALLQCFWENHDPTQGMRQGNDLGTQYRSAIYWDDPADEELIQHSVNIVNQSISSSSTHNAEGSTITTELAAAPPYYYAEAYHQQYLHTHPNGYCGLKGTGISCNLAFE